MTQPVARPIPLDDAPPVGVDESYRRLLRVLRAGHGMFTLIPVESTLSRDERDDLFERLRTDLDKEGLQLRELELSYGDWEPLEVLERVLGEDGSDVDVLLIHGLERTPPGAIRTDGMDRPPAFAQLNQARELVETRYRVPLIVWCEPYTYGALRRHAPDFFDHFTGLVRFTGRERQQSPGRFSGPFAVEIEDAPKHESRASAAAVRFYEQRLEGLEPGTEDHTRALVGLAEALVGRESEEGLAVYRRAAEAAEAARERLSPADDCELWARANAVIARSRGELGDTAQGLKAAEEAVEATRKLVELEGPQRLEPKLAERLHILSNRLHETGDRSAAIDAIRQAVEIRRGLARDNPQRFEPDLASSLNNLSNHLAYIGDLDAALDAIRQAVDIVRGLARDNPQRFEPDLASSLNNLSNHLAYIGDLDAALDAIRQAVDIVRGLARDNPQRFEPDLAGSLNNLSILLANTGDLGGALDAIRQAVDIRRRLARDNPQRFEPELASSLWALALTLRSIGDPAAALAQLEEAIPLIAPHAERYPNSVHERRNRGMLALRRELTRDAGG